MFAILGFLFMIAALYYSAEFYKFVIMLALAGLFWMISVLTDIFTILRDFINRIEFVVSKEECNNSNKK